MSSLEVILLEIMLCGAHDAVELSEVFTQIARDFGAEPWFYQSGRIHHINSKTATWTENSRATVQKADICVFVILNKFGDITWNHELQHALELGKPFVVLALESAWTRYNNLMHTIADTHAISSEDDRSMVELLRMITSDYQITVAPFSYATFREHLRRELSELLLEGVRLLEVRNQRAALMGALQDSHRLGREQVARLIGLATDEYEANKMERKTAIRRLAAEEIRDREFVLDICRSREQGVQRLAFDLFPQLIPLPPDLDLLREMAEIAGGCDDIGVPRRFVGNIGVVDAPSMDTILTAMNRLDEGLRRRAFEGVERAWGDVLAAWGPDRMMRFLEVCEAKMDDGARWTDRLRRLRDDLV